MKKSFFYLAGVVMSMLAVTSCSDDDSTTTTPPVAGSDLVELSGNLDTQTLTKDKKYLIKGQVFVNEGKTLTVQPGTVVYGDKATKGTLIIGLGGKIMAEGTATEPIVFTSALEEGTRDRGDWGGIVLLGKAKVNQASPAIEGITPAVVYGGTNDADNSGILKYVRVEFAGIELTPNNETNSITLGGVGSGTVVEYCQTSFGGDDGFEWFGGAVNGKHLIVFATWDDAFDIDFGFSGKLQYALDVRYPSYADQSGSNSIEADNGPNDNATDFLTTAVISNLTSVGPRAVSTQSVNANFQHSMDLRRRVALNVANSVFVGYPRGIRFNQQTVFDNYNAGTGILKNNVLVADLLTYAVGTGMTADAAAVKALWENAANGNTTITTTDFPAIYSGLGLNTNIFFGSNTRTAYTANPTFAVTSGTLATGASFTDAKLAGLENVTYKGAFGATDWTDGWAEFNPIAKVY
ncbi:hypothetical protein Q765_06500 [Flavobacterium rivuli WB 3.3-2 = DSM 21788]|uniref:T9SS C-terminal target domain-containing protein n=1 Tax=Flavobacterium rivuli WB 3.3-2 = DSM 21788 TaxID=1121895 RepID=A0A0A2M3U8_9FLAO|nr:hypothetical protein [Flavobacterium rivuli]KGO87312.1 hypothetical protein Q765_06500 [Flavobacterium rivuli WB 3.3-2 = DSM 21788]